jgi:hypothetical protein
MTGFAELATATHFSFLRGASSPADMVNAAQALGHIGTAQQRGRPGQLQLGHHSSVFLGGLARRRCAVVSMSGGVIPIRGERDGGVTSRLEIR